MKFSYSEVWNGTVELLRANAAIVIALAGVFIFLPALIMAHFIPSPVVEKPEDFVRMWSEYLTVNGHWLLLSRLITMVGVISLLLHFIIPRGATVGALMAP